MQSKTEQGCSTIFCKTILKVHFEKIPKEEKGFDFNHEDFEIEGKSQATIEISWTPQNGTPLRETVIVKLGNIKAQFFLIGTTKAKPENRVRMMSQLSYCVEGRATHTGSLQAILLSKLLCTDHPKHDLGIAFLEFS